jgi:uncharacterized membrane protein
VIRLLLWLFGGLLLGAIIHIGVILSLPLFASNDVWTKVSALNALERVVVVPAVAPGQPNPLRLDPELTYAACQLDLRKGPGVVSGVPPSAFWSVAVYNRNGTVIYSTTNRDGLGTSLDLGLFNSAQTRLLAEQQLDIAEGLLIVDAPTDDVFAVVRLALPHPAMRARFEAALQTLACGNIT